MFDSIQDAYSAIRMYDNVTIIENGWPLFIRFTKDEELVGPKFMNNESNLKNQISSGMMFNNHIEKSSTDQYWSNYL